MAKEINPRLVAFQILTRLEEHRSNSNILLQDSLSRIPEASDRRLITDLVLGTLRWRGALQYTMARFSRRPLDKIDTRVQVILQLGLYQLLHTDIPQHAAIYETVNLCRRIKLTSAASFANGLLRAVQGKLPAIEEPPDLAHRLSHPEWLVRRWVSRFGEDEAIRLMQANNEPPALYLRINELRTSGAEVAARLQSENVHVESFDDFAGVFRVISGAPQLTRSFVDGDFYIQDAGIETLGDLTKPEAGQSVLEIAAAPGGKTFQLSLRMRDSGRIVSVDSDAKRMKMWRRNMERLGIQSAVPVIADGAAPPFRALFDQVVVDAPCSSLGVVRRHPEIKWWRQETELAPLAKVQLRILEACAKYVRDRGALVYSVCSFEPEETTEVTAQFLAMRPEFSGTEQKVLLPHRDGSDGFFIMRFEKK